MGKNRMLGGQRPGVGGTEGGRSPTEVPPTPGPPAAERGPAPPAGPLPRAFASAAERSDPEVPERPVRRRFTADYKRRILCEADECRESGRLGELLRREGLYSSHLTTWRAQSERGALEALAPRKRGRKHTPHDPLVRENQRLRRENERLAARLRQAETIIEIQKKACEILAIPLSPLDNGEPD